MFPWQRTNELGNLSMFLLTQGKPDVHGDAGNAESGSDILNYRSLWVPVCT